MNRKKLLTILLTLAIAASTTVMMTGCAASVIHLNGTTGETETSTSDTAADESSSDDLGLGTSTDSGDGESEEESSEDTEESSEEESSEADEESSEEESSEEESSEEESSEETEESKEESKSDDSEGKTVIKFTKPDDWGDEIKAYIYLSNVDNNQWPGEEMTKDSDGTYSVEVDEHYMEGTDPRVVFNDGKNQVPKSGGFIIKNGQTYDIDYAD